MSEGARLAILIRSVAVLGPLVARAVFRSARPIAGARTLCRELARLHGLKWTPPKNPQDRLAAGRTKGRYRDRALTVETDRHRGGMSRLAESMADAVVRVRFARSLGMELHGGTGSFRAGKGEPVDLEGPLAPKLRVAAREPAAARALFSDARVVERLAELDRAAKGLRIDDGVLECAVAFPTSVEAFRPAIGRAVDAVEAIDTWSSRAERGESHA